MVSVFPFRQQYRLVDSCLFCGFTDWHCHVLPGVDDGLQCQADSLAVLQAYEDAGVSDVWLTPHIMEDMPNTTDLLRERFSGLTSAYQGTVKLHLASENMIDQVLHSRLAVSDLLPLGDDGSNLLVETSYYTPPMDFYQILDQIAETGYQPVLAHPERYVYLEDEDYSILKSMGIWFQLNLASLCGRYGKQAHQKALRLLRSGCYELAGTDLHSFAMMSELKSMKVSRQTLAQLEKLKENCPLHIESSNNH